MTEVYINPTSQKLFDGVLEDLPQSLLISGPSGIGFSGVIQYISEKLHTSLQVVLPEKDDKVDLEKGTISVDSIRRLYDMTKTVETAKRIIVIDYAEKMGIPAQNAFLKLLEEPGINTHFILLSHQASRLLPTILSRAQQFDLLPITDSQTNALLDQLKVTDKQKRSQIQFIASGLPAEIHRLLADDTYFESRAQIVRDSRTLLQGTAYDRVVLAQRYKDSRDNSLVLLQDALKLVELNIQQGKTELIPTIDTLINSYELIEANGNIRLQLAAVMV